MKALAISAILVLFTFFSSCRTTKATMPADILMNGTWQLAKINGNDVNTVAYSRGLPYVTFTSDNKVTGSSGCNGFSGSYNLNNEGGMNISQVMATKMYCEGIDEKSFFEALTQVNTLKAEKDKLTLMNGTKEILVFVPKQ